MNPESRDGNPGADTQVTGPTQRTTLMFCPSCGTPWLQIVEGQRIKAEQNPPADVVFSLLVNKRVRFGSCQRCTAVPKGRPSRFDEELLSLYEAILLQIGPLEETPAEPVVSAIAFLAACVLKTIR